MGSADADSWSYSAGERGRNRVRAFERARGGNLFVEWHEENPQSGERKRRRRSLGHRDREEAKATADRLAARFAEMDPDDHEHGLTVGGLFDIYVAERTPEVGPSRQKEHRRVSEAMRRYFRGGREVSGLNRQDWDAYARDRRSGAIDARGRPVPEDERTPIGGRAVEKDLSTLRSACRWAVASDLLETDPTEGYPLPQKNTPRRPTISDARYRAMLEVAGDVGWRFRVAFVLAHETGHRSKAIRHLRWSDVDFDARRVRWRGDEDKMGHDHTTALTEAAAEALREAREHRPGVGEAWVFPAEREPSRPVRRERLRDWWLDAEEAADLEHVDGLGWHALRRKLADDLRDLPLKDLAAAGGWKSAETVVRCYQSPDQERIREALEAR